MLHLFEGNITKNLIESNAKTRLNWAVSHNNIEIVEEYLSKYNFIGEDGSMTTIEKATSLEMVKLLTVDARYDWSCAKKEFCDQLIEEQKTIILKEMDFRYWCLKQIVPKLFINGKLMSCVPGELLKKIILKSFLNEFPLQNIFGEVPIRLVAFAKILKIKFPCGYRALDNNFLIIDVENVIENRPTKYY